MFNTQPSLLASKTGATAFVQCTALVKFTRKYFSNPSMRIWSRGEKKGAAPALFTRMSTVPNRSTVPSTNAWTWAGSVTSVGTERASPPAASTSLAALARSSSPPEMTGLGTPSSSTVT